MTHLYCVVYRTGGTDNFQWHRSSAMSKVDAEKHCKLVEIGGRKCHIANYGQSLRVGLPEGYDFASFTERTEEAERIAMSIECAGIN